jgi:hypothetical protein
VTASGHLVVNLLTLHHERRPELALPAVVGALLPDLPQVVFYVWVKLVHRIPEATIWEESYFDPGWQRVFSACHSLILIGLMLVAAGLWRNRWLVVLSSSMLLHAVGDLVLHNDDAHMHLYPVSSWRFESPFSYWDPAHYGGWMASIESLVVVVGSVVLLRTTRTRVVRGAVTLGLLLLIVGWTFGVMVWM